MLPAVSDNLPQKPLGLTYVLVALFWRQLLPKTSLFQFPSVTVEEKLAEVELRCGADRGGCRWNWGLITIIAVAI